MIENEDSLNSGQEILIDNCNFSFFSRKCDAISSEEEVLKCFPALVKTNGLYLDILTKKIRKRCRFNFSV